MDWVAKCRICAGLPGRGGQASRELRGTGTAWAGLGRVCEWVRVPGTRVWFVFGMAVP